MQIDTAAFLIRSIMTPEPLKYILKCVNVIEETEVPDFFKKLKEGKTSHDPYLLVFFSRCRLYLKDIQAPDTNLYATVVGVKMQPILLAFDLFYRVKRGDLTKEKVFELLRA
jgi:hypothetical protein